MKTCLALAAVLLSGCSSLDLKTGLENRVVVTVDMTKAMSVSKYGSIGISSDVVQSDADAIIAGIKALAVAEAASSPASAAMK